MAVKVVITITTLIIVQVAAVVDDWGKTGNTNERGTLSILQLLINIASFVKK
jgi:hypothetical protein